MTNTLHLSLYKTEARGQAVYALYTPPPPRLCCCGTTARPSTLSQNKNPPKKPKKPNQNPTEPNSLAGTPTDGRLQAARRRHVDPSKAEGAPSPPLFMAAHGEPAIATLIGTVFSLDETGAHVHPVDSC